uniref:Uncharacterized protein n=1 Tax=Trypanosoma vivax (strain Y486) TaxID=1055687 RepID=G0TTE7_TRYVY|nr:hypothetical protein TVY486_0304040 [Trypanosoma vivax Y486]
MEAVPTCFYRYLLSLSVCLSVTQRVCVCECVFEYIYIYIYVYVCVCVYAYMCFRMFVVRLYLHARFVCVYIYVSTEIPHNFSSSFFLLIFMFCISSIPLTAPSKYGVGNLHLRLKLDQ